MVDARSVFPLVRQLQSFSPLLLAGPALISVVLHRISQELGGGQFAVSLRCLVVFLLMRLVSLFLGLYGGVPGFTVAARIAWWSAASMFLLAVLYRWRVTVSAGQLAQRYELNAQAELADVSRMLCLPSRK